MPRLPPHESAAGRGSSAARSSSGGDGADDLRSADEIKVYKEEGEDDVGASKDDLREDKEGLVIETEFEDNNPPHGEQSFMRSDKQTEHRGRLGAFSSDHPFSGRLPFGYPLITPYPYPSSAAALGLSGLPHHALPFYMYNNELFAQPPPAHMGLASLHHAGLHSAAASMYGLSSAAAAAAAAGHTPPLYGQTPPLYGQTPPLYGQTPPLYGLPPPQTPPLYGPHPQFMHPFYPHDFSHVGWPSASAYAAMHFPKHFSPGGSMLPPHPGISIPGISHPALVSPQPSLEGAATSASTASSAPFRSSSGLTAGQHRRWHQPYLSSPMHRRTETRSPDCQPHLLISSNHHQYHHGLGGNGTRSGSPQSSMSGTSKMAHVKKPLNAFMLFMKEMRQKVIDECTLKESAAINQVLGRKWHSLSRSEQAKYYDMARKEKELHHQRYPTWSARDNYAIHSKKKRKREHVSSRHDDDRRGLDHEIEDRDCQNAKKCRARFGLDKQNLWCKPCRRKKRCIRFLQEGDNSAEEDEEGDIDDGEPTPSGLPHTADSTTELFSPMPSSVSSNQDELPVPHRHATSVSRDPTSIHMNEGGGDRGTHVGGERDVHPCPGEMSAHSSAGSVMSCDDGTPVNRPSTADKMAAMYAGENGCSGSQEIEGRGNVVQDNLYRNRNVPDKCGRRSIEHMPRDDVAVLNRSPITLQSDSDLLYKKDRNSPLSVYTNNRIDRHSLKMNATSFLSRNRDSNYRNESFLARTVADYDSSNRLGHDRLQGGGPASRRSDTARDSRHEVSDRFKSDRGLDPSRQGLPSERTSAQLQHSRPNHFGPPPLIAVNGAGLSMHRSASPPAFVGLNNYWSSNDRMPLSMTSSVKPSGSGSFFGVVTSPPVNCSTATTAKLVT